VDYTEMIVVTEGLELASWSLVFISPFSSLSSSFS